MVARKIIQEEPKSILDIGVGFGMAGMIARSYADIWRLRLTPGEWQCQIDGIEVFPGYLMPHQRFLYNKVLIGDALELLPTLQTYDLVICIDVLEHFLRSDGERLLGLIADHGRHYVVTTPKHFFAQTAVHGNLAERHLCEWSISELQMWGTVTESGPLLRVER